MMRIKDIRRDPVSPCDDFWHAVRVGVAAAAAIFVLTWLVSCVLL